jgi:hypothetical protein
MSWSGRVRKFLVATLTFRRRCSRAGRQARIARRDPTEGVVPTCVMQNATQLKHKLKLVKACKFDVKLEQRMADPQR